MDYRKATDDIEVLIQLRNYYFSKISDNTFISWLAVDNGEVIATSGVCFYQLPPTYTNLSGVVAYITSMYTKNHYRRKGIATFLFNKILDEIKFLDIHIVRLHASEEGKSLYSKFGFKDSYGYMMLKI